MLPDRVSNPGPLTYESGSLPIALRDPANLDWINNQACSLSQNIYVITNVFITNNYLLEMIRKIIFTNYFSEFRHQVAIKFRFRKALQKKCF